MNATAGLAHHRDDLLDARRVGGVAHPLVPRRAAEAELRRCRRRASSARHIDTRSKDIGPSFVEQ
jgi:hypothetical protein